MDEVFTDFNRTPCGAASLAQVYEAKLRESGERVAVKIQHSKVKMRSAVDIATMEVIFLEPISTMIVVTILLLRFSKSIFLKAYTVLWHFLKVICNIFRIKIWF